MSHLTKTLDLIPPKLTEEGSPHHRKCTQTPLIHVMQEHTDQPEVRIWKTISIKNNPPIEDHQDVQLFYTAAASFRQTLQGTTELAH